MSASPPSPNFPARFHVAVDVVALTISADGYLQVAVVQRNSPTSCIAGRNGRVAEAPRRPHDFALPGGHVDWRSESLEEAACRELHEETGIEVEPSDLVQVGAYGDPDRDPRSGRTVSVAFVAFNRGFGDPFGGSDATHARFIDVIELLASPNRLEFDHRAIVTDAIARVRDRMERYPDALKFCNDVFTLGDVRRIYEVVFADAYSRDFDVESIIEEFRIRRAVSNRLIEDLDLASSLGVLSNKSLSSDGMSDPQIRARAVEVLFSQSRSMQNLDVVVRSRDSSRASVSDRDLGWGDRPRHRAPAASEHKPYDQLVRLALDPANFKRKIKRYIKEVASSSPDSSDSTSSSDVPDSTRSPRLGRPSTQYRWMGATRFNPPLVVTERPSTEPTSDSD
jgi:8-oxo-dGTP diphosphatase